MTIKKFQGKTKDEAIEKTKEELGQQVVIMNVKEVKPSGLFGIFKKSTYEVTGAIEDEIQPVPTFPPIQPVKKNESVDNRGFDAVADEKISIPSVEENHLKSAFEAVNEVIQKETAPVEHMTTDKEQDGTRIEQRLDSLQNLLEQQLSADKGNINIESDGKQNQAFVKMLYNVLLDSEVQEKYVNQILDDMEKVIYAGNTNLDYLISNVYQKMVLKLGQPQTIRFAKNSPKVIFFIGPTGVGKTTTIAKIASKYKVEQGKNVALLTADTYRIAAAEQLRIYANILNTPLSIVYAPEEINDAVARVGDNDLILVDTAGFSHKNQGQREDMKKLLLALDDKYEREVYLVLSATTKYKDLTEIIDIYRDFTDFRLIFTKLDETTTYGNIFNMKLYADSDLSYITTGQNVPDDIEVVDTQKMVKQLLGGH